MARGLANARPQGSAKFANAPPPGTDKAGKCPAVAQGGGGGGGGGGGEAGWAQVELTDALSSLSPNSDQYKSRVIMRIEKVITKDELNLYFNNFFPLPQEEMPRGPQQIRILILILGSNRG